MHADKTNYEYQLEQVLTALDSDRDNTALLNLKKDLQDAIKLSKELAPKKRQATTQIEKGVEKRPVPEQVPKAEECVATEPVCLQIGEKCQIRSEGGGWLDATLSSIGKNRTRWIAITTKTNETKAVSLKDIRPMPEHRAAPILQLLPLGGAQLTTASNPPTQKEKEKRMKKVAARQEYLARKEAEHEQKASAWATFQSKLSRKTSASLFKPPRANDKKFN
ncbi:Survival of motor neuron--splicing factor 30 [Mitosporidium daphniae]|uniref:Tudor domain-containing protein n=1 Tax=Mitosporidium daphniae TaxID=1485682 RepID=A0A098VPD5_9MICR|nr:uncharacterized protein DI09_5p310 [Mitosporidium daphniae]KGG50684.1 hypothetical protein DI09_5p310 [Mitosporidium daphniae]|eukprot:XP_013237111.1 uncharacterized protein DI09_5p310 [Mitosporidium daphniae]